MKLGPEEESRPVGIRRSGRTRKANPDYKKENADEGRAKRETRISDTELEENIKVMVAALRNENARVKKESLFDDHFVWDRLKDKNGEIPWFHVDASADIRNHVFPRYYLSSRFGGSPGMTFPVISSKKLSEHGIDNFAFLSTDMNPHAPTHPGAPGLFFRPDFDAPPPGDKRLFVILKGYRWLYCGTYRFTVSRSLTADEWTNQSRKVRASWASSMIHRGWGAEIVARIHLRAQNPTKRKPSAEDVALLLADEARKKQILEEVTEQQIIDAYGRGEEELGVCCLNCIGYDISWQEDLIRGEEKYTKEKEEEREKKDAQMKASKRGRQGKHRGSRKTLTVSDGAASDNDAEYIPDADEAEVNDMLMVVDSDEDEME